MNISVYDGTTFIDSITIDDPAIDVEVTTFAIMNSMPNASLSRSYTMGNRAVRAIGWKGLTKQKVITLFELIANQWQYQLYYADPRINRTQEVYFDGDVDLTQDGYDEIFDITLRMINK